MLALFDFLLEKNLFLTFFNLSVTASFLVLAVLVLRFLLKKAPKWSICLLWGLVGLRLVFPFSIESIFSLIPSAETVSPGIVYAAEPTIDSGIVVVDQIVNPILSQTFAPARDTVTSINPLQVLFAVLNVIWLLGVVAILLYAFIGYIRLQLRLRTAVRLRENIFQSENVSSPFIFGEFRPRIYLPFSMDEADMEYVIAHEKAHLKRLDHLVKPIAYGILAAYWFNPLLWVAYILFCRDIELACDEKVVREMDNEEKKAYSLALLKCSMNTKTRLACPLAFGEVGVKKRVKNVMNYKKPAFWILILSVVAIVVTAVCFLTVPKSDEGEESTQIYRPYAVVGYDVFVTDLNHPISTEHKYLIDNVNHKFFKREKTDYVADWEFVGSLVECKMNKNKMKALFTEHFYFTSEGFLSVSLDRLADGSINPDETFATYTMETFVSFEQSRFFQELVDENKTIYRIDDNTEWIGYLFCQKNGEVYWGCGYEEDGLIRLLWELTYAKGEPNANIMFPNGEVTGCVGFYQAVEDVGSHMMFSWHVSASETPYYYIDGNNRLFEQERGATEWTHLGTLQEVELSEAQKQLDTLFKNLFRFEDEKIAGGDSECRELILNNIAHMWTLTKEDDVVWSYIFIQLNDGTMFFGKGHNSILRWLYRMERIAEYETYTKPQASLASIVSEVSHRSDLEIKADRISVDEQFVKLKVAFTNTSEKTSYYFRDSRLLSFVKNGAYEVVPEYQNSCAPIYLGMGQTVYRDFIFERSYLESNSYMLEVMLQINDIRVDGVCGYIIFQYNDLE